MVAGVILMDTATWFTFGGIGILIVVIAVDVFHGGDAATGYLNAALGVGGTIGALLSGALVLRPRLGPVLIAGGTVLGVATIALGLSNVIGVAFVAIAVASAGNLILDVSRTTILQRAVPDAFRGRVNGLLYTTQSVSESSGTLVIPILVSVFGFGIVMGVAGVAVIVATAGAVLLIAGSGDVARRPVRRRAAPHRPAAAVRRPLARPRRGRAARAHRAHGRGRRGRHPPGRAGGPVLHHRVRRLRGHAGTPRATARSGTSGPSDRTRSSASAGSSPRRRDPRR